MQREEQKTSTSYQGRGTAEPEIIILALTHFEFNTVIHITYLFIHHGKVQHTERSMCLLFSVYGLWTRYCHCTLLI